MNEKTKSCVWTLFIIFVAPTVYALSQSIVHARPVYEIVAELFRLALYLLNCRSCKPKIVNRRLTLTLARDLQMIYR